MQQQRDLDLSDEKILKEGSSINYQRQHIKYSFIIQSIFAGLIIKLLRK